MRYIIKSMSEACMKSAKYHGRDNSIYRDCKKHKECEECHREITDNMESIYNQDFDEQDICAQYGVECGPIKNTTQYTECEAYCKNFGMEYKQDYMQVCLGDSNETYSYLEKIDFRQEKEWNTYKNQIQDSTSRILSKMKFASPQTKERFVKHLDAFAL